MLLRFFKKNTTSDFRTSLLQSHQRDNTCDNTIVESKNIVNQRNIVVTERDHMLSLSKQIDRLKELHTNRLNNSELIRVCFEQIVNNPKFKFLERFHPNKASNPFVQIRSANTQLLELKHTIYVTENGPAYGHATVLPVFMKCYSDIKEIIDNEINQYNQTLSFFETPSYQPPSSKV